MSEDRKLVRTDRMIMRWGEMDALGHMNNVAYLRYFEEVRIMWIDSLGIEYRTGNEGPILGTLTCKYLRPAIYPLDLEITTYIGRPGKSSFFMWHELYNTNDPSQRFAEAEAKMVWIDIGASRSRPMPEWLRAKLQA